MVAQRGQQTSVKRSTGVRKVIASCYGGKHHKKRVSVHEICLSCYYGKIWIFVAAFFKQTRMETDETACEDTKSKSLNWKHRIVLIRPKSDVLQCIPLLLVQDAGVPQAEQKVHHAVLGGPLVYGNPLSLVRVHDHVAMTA